jgi:tRNA threonylcarbamoyl adenosine modification protein YeaZ
LPVVLLAFDTATAFVTVCAYDDTRGVVEAARDGVGPMRHGELLMPTVHEVLREAGTALADVDRVAVGVGPGPFTGLRVGVVTARMLGLALGVPVTGACTLDVLAADALSLGVARPFVVTTDARRKELFWAGYAADGHRVEGPAVDRPADVPVAGRLVVGTGPELYPLERTAGPVWPSAAALARCVADGSCPQYEPEPLYLRRPDAVTPGPAKRVS